MNFLRMEIPSIHRICQKNSRGGYTYMCVCEHPNLPGRVERREGLWQIDVCQLVNLDFTINMSWFTAQKLSASISCSAHTRAHTHTWADFSHSSLSSSMNYQNNGMGRACPNSISKAFLSVIIDLSNISFCVFKKRISLQFNRLWRTEKKLG